MSAEAADSAICVTVFASSTPQTSPKFAAASEDFGRLLAQAGGVAIFGGGNAGCMGAFYDGARKAGGRVRGITHRMFVKPGGSSLSEENAVELESLEIIEGRDLTMRKRRLLDAADCLVALPGGVGTFDELWMAIAELGVGCSELPVLVLNVDGYYDGSIMQLKRAGDEGMLRQPWNAYIEIVDTPAAAVKWCMQQKTRPKVPAHTSTLTHYRMGMTHGVLVAMGLAAGLLLTASALRRRA